MVGYLAAVFLVLSPVKAVVFIAGAAGPVRPVPGLLVRAQPQGHAHPGRRPTAADFLRRQVLTSRNVRGGWLTDLALGGLNYQIEHHLFPSMPRPNLRRSQALIAAFCQQRDLPYCRDQPGRLLRPGTAPPQQRRQVRPPRHSGFIGGRRPAGRKCPSRREGREPELGGDGCHQHIL